MNDLNKYLPTEADDLHLAQVGELLSDVMARMDEPAHMVGLLISKCIEHVHTQNVKAGWWHDLESGDAKMRNVPEMLALAHSEISEALEGFRKSLPDDKLSHRYMYEVELGDTFIRLLDTAGAKYRMGKGAFAAFHGDGVLLDVGTAIAEKLCFNKTREDHQIEHRRGEHGKKC